jgi:PAS domain S-box-containing protein
MSFGQDMIRNQQGNLSANGNVYTGEEANAFPSASNDVMASGAASLIASNGLSNLVQPGTLATQTPGGPNMPGLYSTTGFDIVSVLAKVANRKDPKTVLGPVDCSCSFVVSVSFRLSRSSGRFETEALTWPSLIGRAQVRLPNRLYLAYLLPIDRIRCKRDLGTKLSILAKPRRRGRQGFQAKVYRQCSCRTHEAIASGGQGVSSEFDQLSKGRDALVSFGSGLNASNQVHSRSIHLFSINLVTVVPITWDSDEVVYHVGFQVDLVEQPNAILRNMRDGSYQVNYTVQNNPQPPLKPAAKPAPEPLPPSSIGISQEMLRLLPPKTQTAVLAGGEEAGKSEWLRLVLANTDGECLATMAYGRTEYQLTGFICIPDFVHVLSLKGQFQYVSPSVRRVLEYEPEDLLNKHISDICHPSDIVPVMRELKDATHTPSDGRQPQAINMLFRVRRKLSGYIWLESSGRLQVESGKGRKAMVLTGRDRTLPAFCWKALDDHGGLTDTEVWAKVSLDGLVLWVTGCVGDIFGGRTNDLVGKSIYSFMAGAEDGPPGPDGHSSSLAVEKAISTSAEGLPKRGATSVRHQLIGLDGRTREVTSNFFAAGSSSAGPITPSRESPTASDDDVRSNVSSFMEDLPFQILVQIKSTPTGIQKPKSAIVHPLTENVFEEMDTTRGTSWQYELHQLKIANRKLKDDIQALRTGQKSNKSSDVEDDGKRAKAKKRKANETGPQPTTDHPTPLHQQTPGFGLAPGRVFKTWS